MSSTARERFVTEAGALFARQGYRSTSVAEIQLACGLTGGSGALYKHFPTKKALLEAVVGRHLDTMNSRSSGFVELLPADLGQALDLICVATWSGMRDDRDSLRVLLRDLDEFPDLLEAIWSGVRGRVYGEFSRWLRIRAESGEVEVADVEATTAVLLASLTCYPLMQVLIDRTPGDLDEQRFRQAWVALAVRTLVPAG